MSRFLAKSISATAMLGLAALLVAVSLIERSHADSPPTEVRDSSTDGAYEADHLVPLDAEMTSVHCLLDGNTTVAANVVVGKTLAYPIFPVSLGEAAICTDGQVAPLFLPNGSTNRDALAGTSEIVTLALTDILASQDLAPRFHAGLKEVPGLEGKDSWGQPRIRHLIQINLCRLDPHQQNRPQQLSRCTLSRLLGKSQHQLQFKVSGGDLEALRNSHRTELYIEAVVEMRCRLTDEILKAEAAVISSSLSALANDLHSKAGDDTALFLVVGGGEVTSESALRTFFWQRLKYELSVRSGTDVPAEVIHSVLSQLFAAGSKVVDLQRVSQNQRMAVLVDNQIMITAGIGELHSALQSAQRQIEKNDIDEFANGEKRNAGGGASFLGIGVNASVGSETQMRQRTERLRCDLAAATRSFEGRLPTVVALDAQQIRRLAAGDSTGLDFSLSNFSVRWQPFSMRISLETTNANSRRLALLFQERAALGEELATLLETATAANERQRASLQRVESIPSSTRALLDAVTDDVLLQSQCESWMMQVYVHIKACWGWQPPEGWKAALEGHMTYADPGGPTRREKTNLCKQIVTSALSGSKEMANEFERSLHVVDADSEVLADSLVRIAAVNQRLKEIASESATLLRMGVQ